MFSHSPALQQKYTRVFAAWGKYLYTTLHLSPNIISIIGFLLSVSAGAAFYSNSMTLGFVFLAGALMFDVFDGSIARTYHLASPSGRWLDTILDRLSELVLIAALIGAGLVSIGLGALTYGLILVAIVIKWYGEYDIGPRRPLLFLGAFIGFGATFYLIIIGQLSTIILNAGVLARRKFISV